VSAHMQDQALRRRLERADHVLPVSLELCHLLDQRYPSLNLLRKSTVMPTGFDQKQRFFSQQLRDDTRLALEIEGRFVMTYIGNIYYSWQNFARTVQIFDLLRHKCSCSLFFLLLIRKQDHDLTLEFLDQIDIGTGDYLLKHADSAELTPYLNAADIGVVLRHDHLVSRVAGLPGKLGDYVACGLPVLTNRGVVGSGSIAELGGGVVLEDMDDDSEVLARITPMLTYDAGRRRRIEAWAHTHHSTSVHAHRYALFLRGLVPRSSRI
jgi:hypothetical protein